MCLYIVDEKTECGTGYGYKGLCSDSRNESIVGLPYYTLNNNINIPTNTWLKADKIVYIKSARPNKEGKRLKYKSGFHIYTSPSAAVTRGAVYKVRYRKVVASGTEPIDGKKYRVVVAREMYVEAGELTKNKSRHWVRKGKS